MRHYTNMTIGMTVDKSEASTRSEQTFLYSTPYVGKESSRKRLISKNTKAGKCKNKTYSAIKKLFR